MKRRRTVRAKRTMNISRRRVGSTGRSVKLTLKRTRYDGSWSFSTASTSGFWRYQAFTPSGHINDFTTLQNMFDEFKIHAIKQTFRPRYDNITAAGVSQAYAHVIIDPESTTAPSGTYTLANVNAFLEQGNVRTYTLNKPFSVYFKPKQLLSTPTSTVVAPTRFTRTTDVNASFSGFHVMLQQNNMGIDNTSVTLDTFTTVYFSVRNLK